VEVEEHVDGGRPPIYAAPNKVHYLHTKGDASGASTTSAFQR